MVFSEAAEPVLSSQFPAQSTREESEGTEGIGEQILSHDKAVHGVDLGHQGDLPQPWQLSGLLDPTSTGSSSGLQEPGDCFVFHLIRVAGSA